MAKPNEQEQELEHPKWMSKKLDYDPFESKYGHSLKFSDKCSFNPKDYSLEQMCSSCETCFPTKYCLRKHLRENHEKSADLHVCPKCKQQFSTKSYAQTHIDENKCGDKINEIVCPFKGCRKKFSDKNKRDKFNAHYLRDHKEEIPFECKQLRFVCASCSWSNNGISNANFHTCKDKDKTLIIDLKMKRIIKRGKIGCQEDIPSSDVQLVAIANRIRCTPSDYFFKRSSTMKTKRKDMSEQSVVVAKQKNKKPKILPKANGDILSKFNSPIRPCGQNSMASLNAEEVDDMPCGNKTTNDNVENMRNYTAIVDNDSFQNVEICLNTNSEVRTKESNQISLIEPLISEKDDDGNEQSEGPVENDSTMDIVQEMTQNKANLDKNNFQNVEIYMPTNSEVRTIELNQISLIEPLLLDFGDDGNDQSDGPETPMDNILDIFESNSYDDNNNLHNGEICKCTNSDEIAKESYQHSENMALFSNVHTSDLSALHKTSEASEQIYVTMSDHNTNKNFSIDEELESLFIDQDNNMVHINNIPLHSLTLNEFLDIPSLPKLAISEQSDYVVLEKNQKRRIDDNVQDIIENESQNVEISESDNFDTHTREAKRIRLSQFEALNVDEVVDGKGPCINEVVNNNRKDSVNLSAQKEKTKLTIFENNVLRYPVEGDEHQAILRGEPLKTLIPSKELNDEVLCSTLKHSMDLLNL